MSKQSFIDYALSDGLTDDEIYTIELLIERVRDNFDSQYWDGWTERNEAREVSDYQPSFNREHVPLAAPELEKLTWLSFQRIRDAERPVRDIKALSYLPSLTGLVLQGNEIRDLSPLRSCRSLRRLLMFRSQVTDISPLRECSQLEELSIQENAIVDFAALECLPKLKTINLGVAQLPQFRRLSRLESLERIDFDSETFDSFEGFPAMPQLRALRGAHSKSLAGVEAFENLENLVNIWGCSSLEPIRGNKHLTHINILESQVCSLESLRELFALRCFVLHTTEEQIDLGPLEALPALHDLTIKINEVEHPQLESFRSQLSSWDIEFLADKPRYTPSLTMEVVDQKTFDHYDSNERYGLKPSDTNESLLSSELGWLDKKLEEVFSIDFIAEQDYAIPYQWQCARSRTIALISEEAVAAFPRLVLGIQNVLCCARNDWIIYFQTEDNDFIIWIYPHKLVVTPEYEEVVRGLIEVT